MDVLRQLFWFYARYVTVVLIIGVVVVFVGCLVSGVVPWCKSLRAGSRPEQPQADASAEMKG